MSRNNGKQSVCLENEDVELISAFEKKGYRRVPVLYVNGVRLSTEKSIQARPNMTLLTFLRTIMGLKGSKLGCNEGGCGACTVMISKPQHSKSNNNNEDPTKNVRHYSVNACLMPVLAADGCHVTTVEGVGSVVLANKLHPVQQAMTELHGSQCGFCTPGIIVSLYTLLTNTPSVKHIEEHLDGNLCRCTGYRPIWDAARSLCVDSSTTVTTGPCGIPCRDCPQREDCHQDCNLQDKQQQQQQQQTTCCSSSTFDKMKLYQDSFLKDTTWLNQANQMIPHEFWEQLHQSSTIPLMVVDPAPSGTGAGTWFQPTTFMELLTLLRDYGGKLVVGNTEIGIEVRFKHAQYPRLIAPSHTIQELFHHPTIVPVQENNKTNHILTIGSCCPLSIIQETCHTLGTSATITSSSSESIQRTCQPIHDMLRWFASTQIRNVACLGGNLVTASPISDMNPLLASMGATLVLSSLDNDKNIQRRSCPVSEFFVSYRRVQCAAAEMVERIEIPVVHSVLEYVYPFKQARRREDDISIVTSGMKLRLIVVAEEENNYRSYYKIDHVALAFGGMAPKTIMALQTAQTMIGQEFCEATFQMASQVLLEELAFSGEETTIPGGQAAYRLTLCTSFLKKFYFSCLQDLHHDIKVLAATTTSSKNLPEPPPFHELEHSGTHNFLMEPKPHFSGIQTYPIPKVVSKGLEEEVFPMAVAAMATEETETTADIVVGKAVTHQSGPLHCTGEALYVDDIPEPPGTLHASLLLSKECGGIFESIDIQPALAFPGVVAVYTHQDLIALGGSNALGPIQMDEVVFLPLGEVVRTVGQVLGIVVAETLERAEAGARLVQVKYQEPTSKIVVTIDDAIRANSFYESTRHSLERGDVSALDALSSTPDTTITTAEKPKVGDLVKVSGEFRSGAQEHFYLETNGTLVVPSEADTNLTIYASTQAPTKTQNFCASATNTPASKVVVRVKRMGGGFGGKETRSVFCSTAVAVAAKILVRPVKCVLPRDVDMKTTGTRHAFVSKYHATAQVTENGGAKLVSMDIQMYNNGGCGLDLSGPVMDRALFHVDGCYNFPNFRCQGVVCKTVQAPHTAFRGFGGPQGMAACEHVMDHLAIACQVPGEVLRRSNMYQNGDVVPFGMLIGEADSGKWNVPTMWDRLETELNVPQRRQQIAEFNAKNKYLKRGICMLPTKFGIAYTAKYMNQGGALVHLYTDGTVLVSHGGTEMGQGLHTKVCQVVAQAFGIPIENVYVNDSSTDKVANTIPTAASMSTDTYGMAALDACRQILKRLEPIRQELPTTATLKQVAQKAHYARIDLSAHGFFAVDDRRCGFDWAAPEPPGFDGLRNSWKGHPFNYFTQGVACTEVEIDVLTGNHRTLRADVMVDVGSSINPAIDIGQIEGAFVQGMGWSTIEDVIYSDDDHVWIRPRGSLFTTGPGTYKIPAFNDAPEIFNVTLLENANNPFAVHSSKAIGEPPFFLGASVFYAIQQALQSTRRPFSPEYMELRMPATSERIRMHAADDLADQAVLKVTANQMNAASYQPRGSY